MRVMMATWDMTGHLNPLVPLGWALRSAGHDVVVVSNPGLVSAITAAGLPAYGAGPEFDSFAVLSEELAKRGWKPTTPVNQLRPAPDNTEKTRRRRLNGFRVAAQAADAQADDAVAFAQAWRPDLVVYEPAGFLGPLIARLHDIPAVRHLWSIDFTAPLEEFETDVIGPLAKRFGLDRLWVNGDMTLSPAPQDLQITDTMTREPIRFVPYNGPSTVPHWAGETPRRPRVLVTWGTSQSKLHFDHMILAPRVVAALADIDVEVVVAVTAEQRALFGNPPDNVVHIGPVPLHTVAPSCTAMIHQGGAGGTMTGLVNGVPQLVISHMPDEVFHARHVEASGAGLSLPGVDADETAIASAVRGLLAEGSFALRARALQAEMVAMPTPGAVAVNLAERLAAGDLRPLHDPKPLSALSR